MEDIEIATLHCFVQYYSSIVSFGTIPETMFSIQITTKEKNCRQFVLKCECQF